MNAYETDELLEVIELAEEEYWDELWSEMTGEPEPYEQAYRELRSEEHEGIFS